MCACREEQNAISYRQMAASKLQLEQQVKTVNARLQKVSKKVLLYETKQESMRAMRKEVNKAAIQAAEAKRACARGGAVSNCIYNVIVYLL